MMKIKIVTAFFDIGRGERNTYKRTNNQYLEYFRFWARIRNEMVIYCEAEYADEIRKIRADYGLSTQTEIVVIEDVFSIEPVILEKMTVVENDISFQTFRYRESIENTSKYSYIMLMKWWFVADTAKRTNEDCFIAWVDFGYNHGGERYTRSEDFDFLWEYDFPQKVNIFCLSDPKSVSLIDSLQFLSDCCIGHTAILYKPLCQHYWEMMKDAMNTLLKIGCFDDDQMLMLMVYRQEPDAHSVVVCDWFGDFQKCSNQEFAITQKCNTDEMPHTSVPVLLRIRSKLSWCIKRIMDPNYPPHSGFLSRMEEKQNKYYG